MSIEVSQLLESLREHGTIDSQGEFTVSLVQASRKMQKYHSSEPARYFLLFVAAGLASGASSVEITEVDSSIVLKVPEAYVEETRLLATRGGETQPGHDAALDLTLGIQGALAFGAQQVQITASHPEKSGYCWTFNGREDVTALLQEPAEKSLEVIIKFPESRVEKIARLFRNLRGYVSQRAEFRLIEKYCDLSRRPIRLKHEIICRDFHLERAPAYIKVGHLDNIFWLTEPTQVQGYAWSGALSAGAGEINLVVNDVTYGRLKHPHFSGIVYHDGLKLDISRESVVHDQIYQDLGSDLEEIRFHWYEKLSHKLMNDESDFSWLLPELYVACVTRKVSDDCRLRVLQRCQLLAQIDGEKSPIDSDKLSSQLLNLGLRIDRLGILPTLMRTTDEALLPAASEVFFSLDKRGIEFLHAIIDYYRVRSPSHTLPRGYLLLGMGAIQESLGKGPEAQDAWLQALDVVRAGADDRAEELIHTHMDFEVEHIIKECGKALAMCATHGG